jgi:hypothetical protein
MCSVGGGSGFSGLLGNQIAARTMPKAGHMTPAMFEGGTGKAFSGDGKRRILAADLNGPDVAPLAATQRPMAATSLQPSTGSGVGSPRWRSALAMSQSLYGPTPLGGGIRG